MSERYTSLKDFWTQFKINRSGLFGLIVILFLVLMAVSAPLIAPYDPYKVSTERLQPPSWNHMLGTDNFGRDIFSQLIFGSRTSLLIGIVAAVITVLIGTLIGVISGFSGGVVDSVLMRITDLFLIMPGIPFMMILAAILGPSTGNIILVLSARYWTSAARLVRSCTLSIKEREYIEASRMLGASNYHLIFRHVLGNVLSLVSAEAVLRIALSILSETGLSFLGLGDPTQFSWGTILHNALRYGAIIVQAWWWVIPPGVLITFTVLGFTFMGYAMQDIWSPRRY